VRLRFGVVAIVGHRADAVADPGRLLVDHEESRNVGPPNRLDTFIEGRAIGELRVDPVDLCLSAVYLVSKAYSKLENLNALGTVERYLTQVVRDVLAGIRIEHGQEKLRKFAQ